ncbi:TIGR02391 family protein [Streptomyces sp. NPDC088358]|uniref:TIGR02391 family protein n=1 Tax=Streptomyces sp. NPDC088358 TaxID=3365857 RepID=UPI0038197E74
MCGGLVHADRAEATGPRTRHTAAARKVNAAARNKMGRRDLSETKLFQSAFSLNGPKADESRLRLKAVDGSYTFRRVHRGAMAFAEGCCVLESVRAGLSVTRFR